VRTVGKELAFAEEHISGILDRVRKGTGPGGFGFEAELSRLLAEAVEDAVESAEGLREVDAGNPDEARIRQEATEERRREIEEVAKRAAEWGQYVKGAVPLGPDEYWEPELRWTADGTAQIFVGRRATQTPSGPAALRGREVPNLAAIDGC
jgi:hypothetical protein